MISIVNVICGFVVGSIIFGVDFASINMGLFAIITAAAMFATTAFGTFLAVFGLITDSMHIILNTVASGLLIFSGSNFPITQLPYMGQIISRALPLTRSIEAANMLFGTIDQNRLSRLLLEEIGIGIIYYIIAFVIIKLVEKIAIKKARLEVF